jgi:ribosomal protein L28
VFRDFQSARPPLEYIVELVPPIQVLAAALFGPVPSAHAALEVLCVAIMSFVASSMAQCSSRGTSRSHAHCGTLKVQKLRIRVRTIAIRVQTTAVRVRTTAVRVRTIAYKGSLGLLTAQPRYFSIASSPRHHGSVAHMTVAVVRYRSRVFQARAPHPHSHAHAHARARMHTHARADADACAHMCTHPTSRACMHAHTHVLAHVHAPAHAHAHTRARTRTHTSAQTHTRSRARTHAHRRHAQADRGSRTMEAVKPHCGSH